MQPHPSPAALPSSIRGSALRLHPGATCNHLCHPRPLSLPFPWFSRVLNCCLWNELFPLHGAPPSPTPHESRHLHLSPPPVLH